VSLAVNECPTTALSNGSIASSCNTDSSSNVPSDAAFCLLEPTVEADSREWTYDSCYESAAVDQMSSKDSSHKSAVNSNILPLSDGSQ